MTPVAKPVGDTGLLFEFGTGIDPAVFDRILAIDAALAADPPAGVQETVPAYVSLLLVYDPLVTDAATLEAEVRARMSTATAKPPPGRDHVIPMCCDADLAPDLADVAAQLGLAPDAVIARHLAAEYRVYMYGFAPGYAYMDGVPPALHLPRKTVPVRSRPVGSIMIAGGQCLITTLPMPTGWWVIGATATAVLRPHDSSPFLFQPGDRVRFIAQSRADFDAAR
ncbi:MAG: kinase [Alphaproteobacteria bacterium]|nr:MAG: kinase [Alphaproteobacteria bacterium]